MTQVTTHSEAVVRAHFRASCDAALSFFSSHAARIGSACEALAGRFASGGTLYVIGEQAQASDANHVSVEFVHPIMVGKRCLPAIAMTNAAEAEQALPALLRPNDVLLALCADADSHGLERAVRLAGSRGALTMLFAGRGAQPLADVQFDVELSSPCVVQEVHETLYHVLWELVHVFLDHGDAAAIVEADSAASSSERALYPFLFGDSTATPLESARLEVQRSIVSKGRDICDLRERVMTISAAAIAAAASEIRVRAAHGGRLLAFGNGGSATDAQDAVADCLHPPVPAWRPMPALALTDDAGVVTAVANDVGFDHVYSRQVLAFGGSTDVALGFSTSGNSPSIIRGLEAAKSRGMFTIALAGNDGGMLARSRDVDICITAPSGYTPRIQEAHATIWHAMLAASHEGEAKR